MPAFPCWTALDFLLPCLGSQATVPRVAYIQRNRPSTTFIQGSGMRTRFGFASNRYSQEGQQAASVSRSEPL